MSIHPEFAERILRGEKRVEFRRRPLGRDTTHLVIYATSPIQAIVGVVEVTDVKRATPSSLWNSFRRVAGIEKADFFNYFEGVTEGFAYQLGQVRWCQEPIPLGLEGLPSRAPQAFQYLETHTLDTLLDACVEQQYRREKAAAG